MTARVMIMAGGTGGHVFPALAVANELRGRGAEVFWLGTRRGLEAGLVPKAGIEIEWVSISGLRGKGVLGWLMAPFRLSLATLQSLAIIFRRRPMVVLGMGGFVSGPGGYAAWLLHKPLLIHEQNAIAGLTNKMLSRLASKAMSAFPAVFPKHKHALITGNPVRGEIAGLPVPAVRFASRDRVMNLLVLGGSLGAQALNETLPQALSKLPAVRRPDVWHQAGQRNIELARQVYAQHDVEARVEPFIEDMAEAYGWADLVICRAGALTVAELAAAGVGALLVPFPYAVDDHQAVNAHYLVDGGAALLIVQSKLNTGVLSELIKGFVEDCDHGRKRLLEMADNARALAKPNAVNDVADLCMEAANG